VVGGNVSFYNETNGEAIFPTPIIGMVGLLDDVAHRCDSAFKAEGDAIVLFGDTLDELGGTEYLKVCHGRVAGRPPQVDLAREKSVIHLLLDLSSRGLLHSAHDLSEGGLAVALAECCIQGSIGAEVTLCADGLRPDALLFGESQGRVVVSVTPDSLQAVMAAARKHAVPAAAIGRVGGRVLRIAASGEAGASGAHRCLVQCAIERLEQAWRGSLERCLEEDRP
jgi:phosphoribosylformylglycinamidine synthase